MHSVSRVPIHEDMYGKKGFFSVIMRCSRPLATLFLAVMAVSSCVGCSVLSHEAIVDALWDGKLKPILLARYPRARQEELKQAHGYAYGGAIIQDLGYYPHGNKKFSDLTHYVRTGDFILALVSESQDLNELAFALGSLSHYVSDVEVHRFATNPGEPMLYPKLERKFGPVITYEQDPAAHLKTEFAFDVLEVAKGRFAPEAYHDFIGFYVAQPVLGRAFKDTYGLELSDLFLDFDRTVGSYRRAVSKTIPKATRIAWAQKKDDIQKSEPGVTRNRFVYVMKGSSYDHDWGRQYDRPSPGERVLAVLLKVIPPIGPLRALKLKMPTPPVEKLFMQSFDRAAAQYRGKLAESTNNELHLENTNYDLGQVTGPGIYRLQDETYAYWLGDVAKKNFSTVTPDIKKDLLNYYHDPNAPIATKRHPKDWSQLLAQLASLKASSVPSLRAQGSATNLVSGLPLR
ncbi:MAG: zinc dependent phospholipase C family protein [Acidobacteriota bacterium]|nr:zinc dependent phospholipase C family protein [Acidobacteriota bacterium]